MKQAELVAFLQEHKWAVVATASLGGRSESALIGFCANERVELLFDTLASSRKMANLTVNPSISLVIGGWLPGDERTVQYEGTASFPGGDDLVELQSVYFKVFPEGRSRLSQPGITYVRVRPSWIRFSDFGSSPPRMHEFTFETEREPR